MIKLIRKSESKSHNEPVRILCAASEVIGICVVSQAPTRKVGANVTSGRRQIHIREAIETASCRRWVNYQSGQNKYDASQ